MAIKTTVLFILILIFPFICSSFSFGLDENELADMVAADLKTPTDKLSLKTVGFWKLINNDDVVLNTTKFQDKLDIDLLGNGNCDVVDRSSFKRIIQEMKLSTSSAVDPESIKRIGKLYGVGGFIYAETYDDPTAGKLPNYYLIVKLIDTETGELLFGKSYRLDGTNYKTSFDDALDKVKDKFLEDYDAIETKRIKRIAVWNIKSEGNSKLYTDKITCAMTETGMLVSDRDNLNLLMTEQTFTSSELVDPKKAIELGHIYGIDGFIYGNLDQYEGVIKGKDREYISELTLKMIDTEKGILVWGYESKGSCIAYDLGRAKEQKLARYKWADNIGEAGLICAGAAFVPILYPEYYSSETSRRTWIWSTASASAACFTTWLILKLI